jgi:hypothetical protein
VQSYPSSGVALCHSLVHGCVRSFPERCERANTANVTIDSSWMQGTCSLDLSGQELIDDQRTLSFESI